MEKMKLESANIAQNNIEKIAQLFPSCLTETRGENGKLKKAINFKVLQQILSEDIVDESDEAYEFTWVGKKEAMVEAHRPINKTLRPCKEESKDWDNTENLYIEGDNLEVLKLLQESYLNSVKMIYIDPPYNTGNDFIYNDDFKMNSDEYKEEIGEIDKEGNRLFKNTDTNGRFHSDWCSMMYSRLMLARNILSDDGVIFISIDDNEQENMKKICNEIFGEQNFIGEFIVKSTPNGRDYGHIAKTHDFVLFYSKNITLTTTNKLHDYTKKFKYKDGDGGYNIHPLYNSNEDFTNINRPNLYYPFYLYLDKQISDNFYEIGFEKQENSIEIYPPKSVKNGVQFVWRWGKRLAEENLNKEIVGYATNKGEYRIVQKMRTDKKIIRSILEESTYTSRKGTHEVEEIFGGKNFSFPKPMKLIKDFVLSGSNQNSIIMDFFSGSATTAHAVMDLNAEDGGNRKFIMVQLPEETSEKSAAYKAGYKNICEIGKERIRRAGDKIKADNTDKEGIEDLDIGFRVLKVDDSNMKDVYFSPDEYQQNLLSALESNIKEDRTDLDLLFGCLLDWGVPINKAYESINIESNKVHIYNDGDLIACFDENISEETIKQIAKKQPMRVVFRDSSFENSPEKINVAEIFKLLSPDTSIKVI